MGGGGGCNPLLNALNLNAINSPCHSNNSHHADTFSNPHHSNDTHHSNTPCHSSTSSCHSSTSSCHSEHSPCHSERSEESTKPQYKANVLLDSSASPQNDKEAQSPNFLIKGNNLLALHSLKHRKDIYGQVKLIYIDPPYNPKSDANTFSYNNNFNHSAWLTFMKNRLEIAREFLREDGIFCIAIDHNELFYLGVLCDEIFGRDNRIGLVSVETNPGGRSDSKFLATSNEFFIAYAKNIEKASINDLTLSDDELKQYKFKDEISNYKLVPLKRTGSNSTPDKRPNLCFPIYYDEATQKISLEKKNGLVEILPIGSDNIMRVWRWGKKKIMEQINDLEVKQSKGVFTISVKDRIKFSKKAKTQWSNPRYDASSYGTKYLYKFKLSDNFSYPKPIGLMEDIIELFTKEGDLILDYHAGSGTTLEAAHKMKRRWIGIEQMDYVESITKKRLEKVVEGEQGGVSKALNWQGGGSFVYLELMPLNAVYKEKISNLQVLKNRQDNAHKEANTCHSKNFASHSNDTHHSNTPCHSSTSSCHSERSEESTKPQYKANTLLDSSASPQNDKDCKQNKTLESTSTQEVRLDNTSTQEITLESIYKDLQEKAFIDYRVDIQAMLKDKDFHALSTSEKKAILYSILDSNMDYVLYDDIEDSEYEIDKDLIALNKAFYGANDE